MTPMRTKADPLTWLAGVLLLFTTTACVVVSGSSCYPHNLSVPKASSGEPRAMPAPFVPSNTLPERQARTVREMRDLGEWMRQHDR